MLKHLPVFQAKSILVNKHLLLFPDIFFSSHKLSLSYRLNLPADTQDSFVLPSLVSLWASSLSSSPVIHTLFLIMSAAFHFTGFCISSNWTWMNIIVVIHLITALIQDVAGMFAFFDNSNCAVQFQLGNTFSVFTSSNTSQGASYWNVCLQKCKVIGVS